MRAVHWLIGVAVAALPAAASGEMYENHVTIPHSGYADQNDPPCAEAAGSGGASCRTLCLALPNGRKVTLLAFMSAIPGRGKDEWSGAGSESNPDGVDRQFEWASTFGASIIPQGVASLFCVTGKNWSGDHDREFKIRATY